MPKATTPQQHTMLHRMWPNDCCLCGHEAEIVQLRGELARLRGNPEPGAICPTCHEKTPNKHALEVRAWRAKRKSKTSRSTESGTEEKR